MASQWDQMHLKIFLNPVALSSLNIGPWVAMGALFMSIFVSEMAPILLPLHL